MAFPFPLETVDKSGKFFDYLLFFGTVLLHDPPYAAADDRPGVDGRKHVMRLTHVLPFLLPQVLVDAETYLLFQKIAHKGTGVALQ